MAVSQRVPPVLEVLTGPQEGQRFPLDPLITIIGRNPDCDVVLQPMSVSRRHASIESHGDLYCVKDLGSTRGTFVNRRKVAGEPVDLDDGALIQIADVLLKFHSPSIRIRENDDKTDSTIFATIDATAASASSITPTQPLKKLRALQRIGRRISTTLDVREVSELTLATLFEIFPQADRGFILLRKPDGRGLTPRAVRSRSGPIGDLTVSRTIMKRVLKHGEAILSKDPRNDYPDAGSIAAGMIRSLMCAPLQDGANDPIGMIQIDSSDAAAGFDQDDLDLLAAMAGQIAVAFQRARLHEALVKQRELERDLQLARQVMQALLPDRPADVAGYTFWEHYEPARQVGGDYYGYIPLANEGPDPSGPPRRWAVAIGDVVGKGLAAALLTSKLSSEIRLFLQLESDPTAVVARLNEHLDPGGALEMFVTFLLIILDVETHRMTLVNAGHPAPLIRRAAGTLESFGRGASSLPLAVRRGTQYHAAETVLNEGDVVVLYSDGVTDALSAAGERFGTDDRLERTILGAPASPAEVGEAIVQAVRGHVAEQPRFDDVTLICLGRTKSGAAPASKPTAAPAATLIAPAPAGASAADPQPPPPRT